MKAGASFCSRLGRPGELEGSENTQQEVHASYEPKPKLFHEPKQSLDIHLVLLSLADDQLHLVLRASSRINLSQLRQGRGHRFVVRRRVVYEKGGGGGVGEEESATASEGSPELTFLAHGPEKAGGYSR